MTLADPSHTSQIVGEVVTDIIVNGQLYVGQVVYVLKDLCVDLILGGADPPVSFGMSNDNAYENVCGLTSMQVEPPHMSLDVKPVATKSRRHTTAEKLFITSQTKRLLKGVIEPSISPWRAQVVIDYSTTVNPYTQLDAYPVLPILLDKMIDEISTYKCISVQHPRPQKCIPSNTHPRGGTTIHSI